VSIDPAGEQQEDEGERWQQRAHDWSVPERQPPRNGCEAGRPAPSRWADIPDANAFSGGVERPRPVFSARLRPRLGFRTRRDRRVGSSGKAPRR
jgi:hypothetical protein